MRPFFDMLAPLGVGHAWARPAGRRAHTPGRPTPQGGGAAGREGLGFDLRDPRPRIRAPFDRDLGRLRSPNGGTFRAGGDRSAGPWTGHVRRGGGRTAPPFVSLQKPASSALPTCTRPSLRLRRSSGTSRAASPRPNPNGTRRVTWGMAGPEPGRRRSVGTYRRNRPLSVRGRARVAATVHSLGL
jgi:hypothetical protein